MYLLRCDSVDTQQSACGTIKSCAWAAAESHERSKPHDTIGELRLDTCWRVRQNQRYRGKDGCVGRDNKVERYGKGLSGKLPAGLGGSKNE